MEDFKVDKATVVGIATHGEGGFIQLSHENDDIIHTQIRFESLISLNGVIDALEELRKAMTKKIK